ncbi:hypothetical protein C2E23DRAFT_862778 [Lenzites betulinus]|nr:hypothetical protein C2E23DRAFT_862778 [Lenzites betulinus]
MPYKHYWTAYGILFLIGWIHRDISSGNVLFYNGRGILGDLEYAKKFDLSVGGHSDPRTGTPFFMAVELQTGSHIYRPHIDLALGRPSTREPSLAVVRHNFQHDVESFFWILLWVSVARIPGGRATATVPFEMSDPNVFNTRRQIMMGQGGIFDKILAGLSEDIREDLSDTLLTMQWALEGSYDGRKYAFEAMETYAPVYGFFRRQLTTLANNVPPGRVPLQ